MYYLRSTIILISNELLKNHVLNFHSLYDKFNNNLSINVLFEKYNIFGIKSITQQHGIEFSLNFTIS